MVVVPLVCATAGEGKEEEVKSDRTEDSREERGRPGRLLPWRLGKNTFPGLEGPAATMHWLCVGR